MKLGKVEIEKRRSGSTKTAEGKMKLGEVDIGKRRSGLNLKTYPLKLKPQQAPRKARKGATKKKKWGK
jgi:hypothetical protein